ncbi:MAG: FAD-binding oxidoreductase, partial [Candidatus Coatesbacteria bacterium]
MPSLFKPLLGDTTPAAVVQPQTEAEVVELVRWAAAEKVPLTPRGKGTSGYGGAIPVKGGVVVDFYRLREVVAVEAEALTATVEAGVTWEKLDRELASHGLTLRLYPTSYPSSTAAGWLAQGGAGLGSYEYGWFRDNVVSARVVLPDGAVREFAGEELDLVADAEGITGLIIQVTLRLMPREKLEVAAVGCPDAHGLQRLLAALVEEEVPIWSLMFINPTMAEMKNRAPLMEHLGHPAEERVLLPAAYVMTLAFRRRDAEEVRAKLAKILRQCEAELLS